MKSGIGTKIRYHINNGTVVCIVTPVTNHLYNYLYDMEQAVGNAGISLPILVPPYRKEYKGIARLKEGDTHDLKLAKEIARKKAIRKMYKEYYNAILKMCEYFGMAWGRYMDILNEVSDRVDIFDNEIKQLVE